MLVRSNGAPTRLAAPRPTSCAPRLSARDGFSGFWSAGGTDARKLGSNRRRRLDDSAFCYASVALVMDGGDAAGAAASTAGNAAQGSSLTTGKAAQGSAITGRS